MKEKYFKKEPSKIALRGSRTHNLVTTRPLLYQLHHHFLLHISIIFLLDVSHAHSDLLIPLFVANVHMISNRKTFVLNLAQFGYKFEKFYLSKSAYRNRVAQNFKMFGGKEPWSFGLLAFCSNTSAIQTYELGESEVKYKPVFINDSLWSS
jgi:hypothetical protein